MPVVGRLLGDSSHALQECQHSTHVTKLRAARLSLPLGLPTKSSTPVTKLRAGVPLSCSLSCPHKAHVGLGLPTKSSTPVTKLRAGVPLSCSHEAHVGLRHTTKHC